MKKTAKNTKATITILSLVAVLAVSAIIAYFTDTVTVINNAKMGIVDIDMKEYTLNEDGQKVQWQDKTNIVPGEVISKIPEISCVSGAVDCYVRAKVEISCTDETLQNSAQMLTLSNLNVNTDDWYYCEADGYFYYKNILTDSSEPIVLFSEVTVPATLNNDWSLEELSIDVTAEAIQSQNFTPNFAEDSSNPWPGITTEDIQECIYPNHVK